MNRLTALILFALLIFGLCYFFMKWRGTEASLGQAQDNVKALQSETETWQNKAGQWESKALSASGTIETLQITHQEELEEIAEAHNAKVKHLRNIIISQSSTTINSDTKPDSVVKVASGIPSITPKFDSRIYFSDINPWYTIKGYADPLEVSLDIAIKDSISYTTLWKRQGLFKGKALEVRAISHNPYTKITNTQSFLVEEKPTGRFGIGPQIGVGISSDLTAKVFIGAGIQYNLIRF